MTTHKVLINLRTYTYIIVSWIPNNIVRILICTSPMPTHIRNWDHLILPLSYWTLTIMTLSSDLKWNKRHVMLASNYVSRMPFTHSYLSRILQEIEDNRLPPFLAATFRILTLEMDAGVETKTKMFSCRVFIFVPYGIFRYSCHFQFSSLCLLVLTK